MATKYNLTTAFTVITETSGTIQNVGKESVELASSTNAVEGEGIVLNPSEKRSFKGALSARSMGDAGAVVNVVDFTEAGEGGEEYDLPIASATTLGGVKIGNSFTVANDGTLNIKKSGKTILGGVKSSDDEGKVAVNNDGTMTYNPLGYRQPSTTYTTGNIAYHSALPTGWYLECTTAGTSGSGDLSISSPSIGGTVSDGTVVWTVSKDLSLSGGAMIGSVICRNTNDAEVYIIGGNNSTPGVNLPGARLALMGMDRVGNSGDFFLQAYDKTTDTIKQLHGEPDGKLSWLGHDLAGSAIVAKSLGENGYIKYASGLIVQWGRISMAVNTITKTAGLPIAFTTVASIAGNVDYTGASSQVRAIDINIKNKTDVTVMMESAITTGGVEIRYIAIGY